MLVGSDPALAAWRKRILALASDLSLPTVCEDRGYATDGCLMSYGADISHAYRQAGMYAARLIRGEKPSDLPVMQPTKFDFSSISRPPRLSTSTFLTRSSPAPTR